MVLPMNAPDWSVTCPRCKATFDSHDSYGDSLAMLREHLLQEHPDKPEKSDN